MTDKDIIKALECCINNKCSNCPLRKMACSETVAMENALDLINRLQAQNEGLQKLVNLSIDTQNDLTGKLLQAEENYKTAKTEAIKEFAEALNEKLYSFPTVYNSAFRKMVDNLVKEITEQRKEDEGK